MSSEEVPTKEEVILVHKARPSFISEMLKVSDFKTIYNMFCAVMIWVFLSILIENYIETGHPLDLSLFFWIFSDFPYAASLWVLMFVTSFSVVPIQQSVVKNYISTTIAFLIYLGIFISLHYFIVSACIIRKFPPGAGFFVMCELVRFTMKMHSFMMTNFTLRRFQKKLGEKKSEKKVEKTTKTIKSRKVKNTPKETQEKLESPKKKENEHTKTDEILEYPANVNYHSYFYFLFAPTLIYQTSYPRTERINWGSAITHFLECFLCVLSIYLIFVRHILPVLPNTRGDYPTLTKAVLELMSPAIMIALLSFYGLLHCWMNAWAEITRFADRQFYRDWWNSFNWATYYRKWNVVVHLFLHRHLFVESIEIFRVSKNSAMWITFIISAIFHEYIIAVAFGFYKPVLFMMFTIPGVFFIYLTKSFKDHQILNIFMWMMLFIGHGLLVALYSRAWYIKRDPSFNEPFTLLDIINVI